MITSDSIWRDSARPGTELPALHDDVTADACVVGLGGSGLACIGQLVAHGRRVVGLDARSVAAGAAGGNGGFLLGGLALFHHDAVDRFGRAVAKAIYEETLEEIDRIAAETPDAVRRSGTLRIATSAEEDADCRVQLEAMRHDGLPVEPYTGSEGRGLLFPADAAFDPASRCRALARSALRCGARLFEGSPAVSIDDGLVTTPNGRVRTKHVVVAVDGRLERVLPELATRVRSARLQMIATAPAHDIDLPRPVYARWGLDYWQQRHDRRIVLGGCRDVGGDDEWTTDDAPTDRVQNALDRLLREGVRSAAPVTHRWAATVGYTPSGLPILEQIRPGVWAIGGYSGTGNVIGAMCGRAVADLVCRARSSAADLLRA